MRLTKYYNNPLEDKKKEDTEKQNKQKANKKGRFKP